MLPPMTRRFIITAIAGALGCVPTAFGQDGPDDAAPDLTDTPSRVQVSLHASALYSTSADFDDAGGEVGVFRAGGGVGIGVSLSQTMGLRFGFDTEQSFYDFGGPVTLAPGTSDPWEDIHTYDFNAQLSAGVDEHWSWFVGGTVKSSGESGADFGDSLTYGGFGGVRYKVSESLTVGVGVAVSSRLEDDARVFVLPAIEWQIDDFWSVGSWDLAGQGGGYALRYQPSDDLTLGIGAAYIPREFRLDENGPVPGGVGRDDRVPVVFFAAWSPDPSFSVQADVGADVYGKLEVLNASGAKLGEDETNTAFTFGVSATFRF